MRQRICKIAHWQRGPGARHEQSLAALVGDRQL